MRWLLAVAIATTATCAPGAPAPAVAACDVDVVRLQAQQTFPEYEVKSVRADGGVVTLLLAQQGGTDGFAIALLKSGTAFFTSVIGVRLDVGGTVERARVEQLIAGWYEVAAVQHALEQCAPAGAVESRAAEEAVRSAATAAVGDYRLGDRNESRTVIGALLLALAMVSWPVLSRRPRSQPRAPAQPRDLGLLLCLALVAVAIGAVVAWRLAPETDEVVTLGTRNEAFAELLSWRVGNEPFNPPGAPALFALWLRLAGGFFWARVFSLTLIPLTAWAAYRAGSAMAGRHSGLSFAALVIMAPSYLRLAAIARGYALIVFAMCLIVAAVAGTRATPARGAAVGAAGVLGLWVSYLLWPLAFAAPWMARLDRRDRLRVVGALAVMAAGLAPRIGNGFTTAMSRSETFELRGPVEALGYALAAAGQAAPGGFLRSAVIAWAAGGIATALITVAIVRLRRTGMPQLRQALLVLALLLVPVLALLAGAHGIRERHVIGLQIALALLAAIGLGQMLAAPKASRDHMSGWVAVLALVALSAIGNTALVRGAGGWIPQLDRLCAGADLLVVVPRSAQMSVHAMLTGEAPVAGQTARWPPVCQTDTEWWCLRVGPLPMISVDAVSDEVMAAAAGVPRSIWIFAVHDVGVPARMRGCEQTWRDSAWSVFDCSASTLR